jgi:hypothetical protein
MRRRIAIAIAIAACGALATAFAGAASGARVRVGTLVLRADGGFTPRLLPKRSYAPIKFEGFADVETTDGSIPPATREIKLEFDHDGHLTTAGLPVCPPARIEAASPAQARSRCAGAIVGTGQIEAAIAVPGGGRVAARSPLTFFNGPRQDGDPTVLIHAQTAFPALETFVVVVPIERRSGAYGYRVEFEVPQIARGLGALTHIDARIGRRYRAGGAERSYVSARCSDYVLQTRGFFSFADGNVISGSVFKPCRPLP